MTFGKLDMAREKRLADQDSDLIAVHLEPFLKRFVSTEVVNSPNAIRRDGRMEGLAKAMARALVKAGTAGKTDVAAVDDIARLQTAFDDEMTALHDQIVRGDLTIEDMPQRFPALIQGDAA